MAQFDFKKATVSVYDGTLPSLAKTPGAGATGKLTFTAKTHRGSSIQTITAVAPVTPAALAVAVSGSNITITLHTTAGTKGSTSSANAAPWRLANGQTLIVTFDTGGAQTFTFAAARSTKAGGAFSTTPGAGTTILIKINGGATQTILMAGTETTAALAIATINAQLEGGFAVLNAGAIDISSDRLGTGSLVEIVSGTALVALGLTAGTAAAGTGDAVDIEATTGAEVLTKVAALTNGVASFASGILTFTSNVTGGGSTAAVTGTSAAAFGFSGTGTGTTSAAPISTADQVKAAIDADPVASTLVSVISGGSGLVDAFTQSALTGGNFLTVILGEGSFTANEKKNRKYTLNRGKLGGVMDGDEVPVEIKFDARMEMYLADAADPSGATISIVDALKFRGLAASWVTSDVDECNPKCVDLEIKYSPACGNVKDEWVIYPDFRYEDLGAAYKEGTFNIGGKCNVTEPIVVRQ